MGVGDVDSLVSSRQYANCFSLTSNSNFFESMYELIQQSDTEGSSSSSDDSDSSSSSSEDYISDSETSSEDSPYHGSSSGSSSSSGDVLEATSFIETSLGCGTEGQKCTNDDSCCGSLYCDSWGGRGFCERWGP